MNSHPMLPQWPEGEPPSRPGRKLGPVAASVGAAHRAWLEPVRIRFLASGLTVTYLSERTGYAKSKISELLRGIGRYPRWEIAYSVMHVLDMPTWPMRRLWRAAAVEARKKPAWIDRCIEKVALSIGPALPPVDHRGFMEGKKRPYMAYTRAFLPDAGQAHRLVDETFDVLWLRWHEALTSPNIERFAWRVLRQAVMARTPHTDDGRPDLRAAGFNTVALNRTPGPQQLAQIEESMTLLQAMSRLPDQQLDVMVLKHMRGMHDAAIADVLGVPLASVHLADRYAKQQLTNAIYPQPDPGGPSQ
ncbi:sigma-70 family RNA polymerase sigma factor [Streptomyces sp. 8N706]|uniref:sigma-70 family RNA polymerase sigma factor n=1 Tax=Streptomyces sp. 8N706 TaxID=3457416 RepID=UPI003FD1D68C